MARKEYTGEVVSEQGSLDDILLDMGVELGEEIESDNFLNIPEDYDKISLNNMEDEEEWEGKPFLSEIETRTWTNKDTDEEETLYQVTLFLMDDDAREAYLYPIKIKTDTVIQEDIHPSSKLHSLITGLCELEAPGISTQLKNRKTKCNLDFLKKKVESYKSMSIRCKTEYGNIIWNNFVITEAEKE